MSTDSMSTLKRALAILDLFSLATPVLTAEEIISKLSYSAPTGYRYIRDLSDLGYLLRMTGGGYKLGPRIIELDHLIIDGDPVLGVARPIMREVVDQVGGDVLLSVIHGLRILNIHHERGPDALGIPHGRGRAHPLFRGATAKTILAFLPRKDQRKLYEGHAADVEAAGLGATQAEFIRHLDEIRVRGRIWGWARFRRNAPASRCRCSRKTGGSSAR
ncbi:helix-turn-helix domain-containing protein [Achromobacter xylosoxidans]